MLSYLEKFHNLPPDLQDRVSTPAVMQAIAAIEAKYGVSLAVVVMKVMVKDVSLVDLPKLLVFEFGLDGKTARLVVEELKDKVFGDVSDYLGIVKEPLISLDKDVKLDNWMEQKQAEAGIRSSTFFFSSEDEEEIKNLTTKLTGPEIKPTDNTDVNSKIELIVPALQVNFSSAEMTERLKKILFTYLRGVRNKIDTRQTLMKSVDAGGMGLDTFLADKILTITDKINSEPLPPKPAGVEKKSEQPLPEAPQTEARPKDIDELVARLKKTGVRDIDYDFTKLAGNKPPAPVAAQAVDMTPPVKAKPKDIVLDELSRQGVDINKIDNKFVTDLRVGEVASAPISTPPDLNNTEPDASQSKMRAPVLNIAAKRQFAGGKGKMTDVKFMPKLVGPIDELGEMDLVNYRRLNDDPKVSAATIREKISFLEEDGYAQKLAGVKAWRQSPLNRLYIEIGNESISKKTGIDDVIMARKTAEKEYLMPEEFYSIMDLNKSLRF